MTIKSNTALEKSILKWDAIVKGNGIDKGAENCELCKRSILLSYVLAVLAVLTGLAGLVVLAGLAVLLDCLWCPVKRKAGKSQCQGTPYEKWKQHQNYAHSSCSVLKVRCATCKKIAQKELEFLKSLRRLQP